MRIKLFIDGRKRYDTDLFLGSEGIVNIKLILNKLVIYSIEKELAQKEAKHDFRQ